MKNLLLSLSITPILFACCHAQTNLLPQGDQAQIISTSSSSDCCVRKAKEEAEAYCAAKNKALYVINEKTEYQGADRTAKAVIGAVGALSGRHTYGSGNTQEDYRTAMTFKCQ